MRAANESSQLKSLTEDRGAVMWVATKLGPDGTVMVVDGVFVLDFRNNVSKEDESLAEDYIKRWRYEVSAHWVVPCRRSAPAPAPAPLPRYLGPLPWQAK